MKNKLYQLAEELGDILGEKNLSLTTAESCTGGWLAQTITEVPNCSHYFDRGFVTYSNDAKIEMLGVRKETIAVFGAVSENTVREMAEGAIKYSHAQVSLAITGIAGPTGATADKPIGTVFFAWCLPNKNTATSLQKFSGDRNSIRQQAVQFALAKLIRLLKGRNSYHR